MQSRYQFREITKSGVPQMFSMILKRMEWMDEKGIQQWNAAKYDTIYPLSYYEEKRLNGEVFVLVSKDTKELISAAVLKEQDDRWNDSEPALYLHNFVTRVEAPGAGSIFLRFAEEYALKKGKKYLRLDSAADNPSLARYYSTTKKRDSGVTAQRLAPRRKGSLWSELNKERCRRMERFGQMTNAGRAVLPDMSEKGFVPRC